MEERGGRSEERRRIARRFARRVRSARAAHDMSDWTTPSVQMACASLKYGFESPLTFMYSVSESRKVVMKKVRKPRSPVWPRMPAAQPEMIATKTRQ